LYISPKTTFLINDLLNKEKNYHYQAWKIITERRILFMGSKRIILANIFLFILVLSSSTLAADWEYFCTDADDNRWFYDPTSIAREQGTVKVWTKIVLSDKAKADVSGKFQAGNRDAGDEYYEFPKKSKSFNKKFQAMTNKVDISHRIDRYDIDCVKNRMKVMRSTLFDLSNNVLRSENISHPEFDEIAPDNVMYKLVEVICKEGDEK
jgi:hypothetical protein